MSVDYDRDKVDEVTLALLYLVMHHDKLYGARAWWDTMDRLHVKGFIGDPRRKAKSVAVTAEGRQKTKLLFEKHFGTRDT